ncbi:MAG TPA: hypothetical protein VGV35_06455 [Bryobacteraceae bacterium]|nr:hypothetical protein [Bryobacteraceae bacterium]
MKLRLQENSLRLRLNQAEVAQFSKTGHVEESIDFGAGANLTYVLESSSKIDIPHAAFQNGQLRVQMPSSVGRDWVTTDRVGVEGEQTLAGDKQLSILIEKDFQCIHRDEPEPDAYPNPLATK